MEKIFGYFIVSVLAVALLIIIVTALLVVARNQK